MRVRPGRLLIKYQRVWIDDVPIERCLASVKLLVNGIHMPGAVEEASYLTVQQVLSAVLNVSCCVPGAEQLLKEAQSCLDLRGFEGDGLQVWAKDISPC